MAIDTGNDTKLTDLANASTAAEWFAIVKDILYSNFHSQSQTTEFGEAGFVDPADIAPVSMFMEWGGGSTIPSGWLLADGRAVSKSTYSDLYDKIGDAWGTTPSDSTFRLPDTRRMVLIGRGGAKPEGSLGPDTDLADTGGSEQVVLTKAQLARHRHGPGTLAATEANAHSHSTPAVLRHHGRDGQHGERNGSLGSASTRKAGRHDHDVQGTTAEAGAASPDPISLYSACIVVDYLIKF